MSNIQNPYHPLEQAIPPSPQRTLSDPADPSTSPPTFPPELARLSLEYQASTTKGLARWDHRRFMLVIPILAAVLQTVLLAGSIYVTTKPWIMPTDDHITSWTTKGKITVKEYNIFVSLVGAGISAIAGLALAIGAKCHIARRLASRGISLEAYETLRKIGESRLPSRTSVYALAPVALFLLSNSAAPAIISIWQAGTSHVSLTIETNFTSFATTFDFQTAVTDQSTPWECESLVYEIYDDLGATFEPGFYLSGLAEVDGTSDPWLLQGVSAVLPTESAQVYISTGFEPWISYLGEDNHEFSIASFRHLRTQSVGAGRADQIRLQVDSSISTTINFTAPLVVAQSSCEDPFSFLTANLTSTEDGAVRALVEDQGHCPGTTWDLIYSGGDIMSSMVSCINNRTFYAGYFFINATNTSPTFSPLASCLTTVTAGTKSGVTYSDVYLGWVLTGPFFESGVVNSSLLIEDLEHPADATALSQNLVAQMWGDQSQGGRGSTTLNKLVTGINDQQSLIDPQNSTAAETTLRIFKSLTGAMAAMAVSKQLYAGITASAPSSYDPYDIGNEDNVTLPSGTATPAFITCSCLKVGPSGWEKLYLAVVAAMWLAVLLALIVSLRNPPVSLDPLDPISMLLVAQNSPPSAELEGGCTGDVDRLHSRKVKMRLCAVDSERLGFVYGEEGELATLPSPVIGRSYGALSRQRRSPSHDYK